MYTKVFVLEIDGSQQSGSGTIVRYAVGLASLLRKNLHLKNIRYKRKKRGLRPQHLKAVQACADMTKGSLQGAEVGSEEIIYKPGKIMTGGTYVWDIGTSGSATMLAQTILPLACFAGAPSRFQIVGGLFQDFAPAAHHLQRVVYPLLKKMGMHTTLHIKRPGYVPTGEGIIEIEIEPIKTLRPFHMMKQGNAQHFQGVAISSHLEEREVSARMAQQCYRSLKKYGLEGSIEQIDDTKAYQKGASLTVCLTTSEGCIIGADMAGKPGRSSEFIGKSVARMLIEDLHSGATVDRHMADQLIIYCALARGTSRYIVPAMTEHVETNLWLIQEILQARTEIAGQAIAIEGINFSI